VLFLDIDGVLVLSQPVSISRVLITLRCCGWQTAHREDLRSHQRMLHESSPLIPASELCSVNGADACSQGVFHTNLVKNLRKIVEVPAAIPAFPSRFPPEQFFDEKTRSRPSCSIRRTPRRRGVRLCSPRTGGAWRRDGMRHRPPSPPWSRDPHHPARSSAFCCLLSVGRVFP